MAFESNYVTFIGNLTQDPDLKFTQGGSAVCTIRLASNRKWTDRNGAEQEETTFINVIAWRDLATNVGESFSKGDRAIAIGKLKVRDYVNKDGITVYVTEIEADEVAPSLRWAKVAIERSQSSGGGSRGPSAGGNTPTPPPSDDDVPF